MVLGYQNFIKDESELFNLPILLNRSGLIVYLAGL